MDELVSQKLFRLGELIGRKIKDQHYYLQAITCPSYAKEYNDVHQQKIRDHQSLATVGDTILKAYLAVQLFLEDEQITKSELTEEKSSLENNENLNEIGKNLGLKEILLYRNNDLDDENKKSYATAIEAIIGAIYLEGGIVLSDSFIKNYIFTK